MTRNRVPAVVLFDIDGTLLDSGGAGARALGRAFEELLGLRPSFEGVRFDGATDPWLVREISARAGRELDAGTTEALLERYVELLPAELTAATRYRLLPGVVATLDALGAAGAPLGLCTGNVVRGARAKLSHGGLWERFPFGGFGSDAEARDEIVRAALSRAAGALGRPLAPEEALVVGDTPRDVAAARAAGVPCLAVASGRHDLAELRATGAEHAAASLESPEARRALFGE